MLSVPETTARSGATEVVAVTPAGGENPAGAAQHALLMAGSAIVVGVLNYAINIVMGWRLPVEEYGRVGVSQTIILLAVWFLSAGLPWVVSRSVAKAHGAGPEQSEEGAEAWRTYKTAWVANFLLALLVVGGIVWGFYSGALNLGSAYAPLIVLVALTISALGISVVPDAALQGLLRFKQLAGIRTAEAVVNAIVSVALVFLGFGAGGALAGFALAAALTCGLSIWAVWDKHFWRAKGWGGMGPLREALPMTLAVFGAIILTNIDLLAVKFLSGANSDALSGAYQVAAVLARAPLYIGTALVSAYYPRIARDNGRLGAARDLMRSVALGVLPLNVVLAVGAPAVVLFFFPERYASSGVLLALLSVGSAALVVASALASVLQARHQVAVPATVMTLAVAVQLMGLAVAVPAYGNLGAAVVSAGAGTLAALLLAWYCRRLHVAPEGLGRQAVALAVLALPVVLLSVFFAGAPKPLVALWVALSFALYTAVVFALNLLDARALAAAARLERFGPLGTLAGKLLGVGAALNRVGLQR